MHSLNFTKATTGNLQAVLRDKGANVPISHFNTYIGKKTVSSIINITHGRKKMINAAGNKAFLWKSIVWRQGKERFPLQKVMSISSPVSHGNHDVWVQVKGLTQQDLYVFLDEEIEKVLDGITGGNYY